MKKLLIKYSKWDIIISEINEIPGMYDNSCNFEPTFTLNGIPISVSGCQASDFAVEGRSLLAVTHLAWLGVKIQGPAFWGFNKRSEDSTHRLRWMESSPKTSSDRKNYYFYYQELSCYIPISKIAILCAICD